MSTNIKIALATLFVVALAIATWAVFFRESLPDFCDAYYNALQRWPATTAAQRNEKRMSRDELTDECTEARALVKLWGGDNYESLEKELIRCMEASNTKKEYESCVAQILFRIDKRD
jgi:hypothetical protein